MIDTEAEENHPTVNYGTATALKTQGSTTENNETFIQFSVSGIPAGSNITSATLTLYCYNAVASGGPSVRQVANNWTETGLTWDARPAEMSADLDSKSSVAANADVTFNLLPAITGNGTYSFKLLQISSDYGYFYSREWGTSSQRPRVSVTYAPSP